MATGTIEFPGWDLLWTNPNPDASFPNQNISVDLSSYRFAGIAFKGGGIQIAEIGVYSTYCYQGYMNNNNGTVLIRGFTAFGSQVNFYDNHQITFTWGGSTSHTTRQDLGQPLRIYGIK
jgi:hypothetical protein